MIQRHATVQWRGNLKDGIGFVDLESEQLLKVPYSYSKRFLKNNGTNPEELLVGSLASCFAMTMARELEKNKLYAENIDIIATVSINDQSEGWEITKINLDIDGYVPKTNQITFHELAKQSLVNCPIAQILKINIELKFKDHTIEIKNPVIH